MANVEIAASFSTIYIYIWMQGGIGTVFDYSVWSFNIYVVRVKAQENSIWVMHVLYS